MAVISVNFKRVRSKKNDIWQKNILNLAYQVLLVLEFNKLGSTWKRQLTDYFLKNYFYNQLLQHYFYI